MKRKWLTVTGPSVVLLAAVISGIWFMELAPDVHSSKRPPEAVRGNFLQQESIQTISHEQLSSEVVDEKADGPRTYPSSLHSQTQAPSRAKLLQDTSWQQQTPAHIYYRNKVIVLMYHEVTPGQKNKQSLNAAKFEQQLKLMQANGFQWITMNQYVEFVRHAKPVPPNAVLMTFDDGYESFHDYVYPLLLQYHVPATSFLIVNTIDNPKHVGIPKLTWNQILRMHKSGVDFYSHSFDSHAYAPLDAAGNRSKALLRGAVYVKKLGRKETTAEYMARVRTDLEQANAILREKIGNDKNVIAFPYGVFSPALLRVCKDLDMPVSFTVLPGINRPGDLNGYRLNAGGADNDPEKLMALMKDAAAGNKLNAVKSERVTKSVVKLETPHPKQRGNSFMAD